MKPIFWLASSFKSFQCWKLFTLQHLLVEDGRLDSSVGRLEGTWFFFQGMFVSDGSEWWLTSSFTDGRQHGGWRVLFLSPTRSGSENKSKPFSFVKIGVSKIVFSLGPWQRIGFQNRPTKLCHHDSCLLLLLIVFSLYYCLHFVLFLFPLHTKRCNAKTTHNAAQKLSIALRNRSWTSKRESPEFIDWIHFFPTAKKPWRF